MGIKQDRQESLARLYKAAQEGREIFKKNLGSESVAAQAALNDKVVDMLDTGGVSQLVDKSGKLQDVVIKGLE